MFKLFNQIPTSDDYITDLCDYLEFKSIISSDNTISVNDILKDFLRSTDEDTHDGIDDVEDLNREKLELVSSECQRRAISSGDRYPFELEFNGEVIRFLGLRNTESILYVYLLFATRLDMRENRRLEDIDGTNLLELISSEVSKSYFGGKSQSYVMGTSTPGGFRAKVAELISLLGEGFQFVNANEGPVDENDGGLDIVVWIDFSDRKPSKLIAFGQCKTGTNWETHIQALNSEAFCKLWFSRQPVVTPVRLFFVADIVHTERWYKVAVNAGLLFDRLRIVDHMPENMPDELIESITTWTNSAIQISKARFN